MDRTVYAEAGFTRAVVKNGWKYIAFRLPQDTLRVLPPDHRQSVIHTWNPKILEQTRERPESQHLWLPMIRAAIQARETDYYMPDQLYHLVSDPSERRNLASDPAHLEKLLELKREMARILATAPGSFGELKFETTIRGTEVAFVPYVDGNLDLTPEYNVLTVADGSRLTESAYTIIRYAGNRAADDDFC